MLFTSIQKDKGIKVKYVKVQVSGNSYELCLDILGIEGLALATCPNILCTSSGCMCYSSPWELATDKSDISQWQAQ